MLPVGGRIDFVRAHSMHVHDVNGRRHLVDENERSNSSKGFLQLGVKQNEVIPTDRCNITSVGEFVLGFGVLLVSRD